MQTWFTGTRPFNRVVLWCVEKTRCGIGKKYPKDVECFGQQLQALGITAKLGQQGAHHSNLIMINNEEADN